MCICVCVYLCVYQSMVWMPAHYNTRDSLSLFLSTLLQYDCITRVLILLKFRMMGLVLRKNRTRTLHYPTPHPKLYTFRISTTIIFNSEMIILHPVPRIKLQRLPNHMILNHNLRPSMNHNNDHLLDFVVKHCIVLPIYRNNYSF